MATGNSHPTLCRQQASYAKRIYCTFCCTRVHAIGHPLQPSGAHFTGVAGSNPAYNNNCTILSLVNVFMANIKWYAISSESLYFYFSSNQALINRTRLNGANHKGYK